MKLILWDDFYLKRVYFILSMQSYESKNSNISDLDTSKCKNERGKMLPPALVVWQFKFRINSRVYLRCKGEPRMSICFDVH